MMLFWFSNENFSLIFNVWDLRDGRGEFLIYSDFIDWCSLNEGRWCSFGFLPLFFLLVFVSFYLGEKDRVGCARIWTLFVNILVVFRFSSCFSWLFLGRWMWGGFVINLHDCERVLSFRSLKFFSRRLKRPTKMMSTIEGSYSQ